MRIAFVVLPLLVLGVVGVVLIVLGVRGRPVFALPRCRKCGYDLRNMQFASDELGNCPECGSPLSAPNAVTFGRWQRRPRQIVLGFALLLLPWPAVFGVSYLMARAQMRVVAVGPAGVGSQSTPALLASLPKSMNSPWEWQELERRMTAGTLTTADVDAALAALTAQFNADRAAGKPRQPMHWYGNFVAAALTNRTASQPAIDAMCQAYYGQHPPITMRKLARAGEPIPAVLNRHESWDIEGMRRVWALTGVTTADGTKLKPLDRYRQMAPLLLPDALSGSGSEGDMHVALAHELPPGEHELTFEYEVGVVPRAATLVGLDGKPGAPERWPSPVSRWKASAKRTVTVVAKDQEIVTLVTDPARSPFLTATIAVEQALARPSSKGVELVIRWKTTGEPSPVCAYHVWAQAGAEKVDYGTLVVGKLEEGSVNSYSSSKAIKSLPPDVTSIDVLLTPDTKAAERSMGIEEIWGQPLELKAVTLQRFDIEPAK